MVTEVDCFPGDRWTVSLVTEMDCYHGDSFPGGSCGIVAMQ